MSLLEWLGESIDPGEIGTVDVGNPGREPRTRGVVLACLAVSLLLLGGWGYVVIAVMEVTSPLGITGIIAGTILYLVAGFFIHPQPDTSNIGWLGGLIDHPFRYSDDVNRFLLFLMIFLWPGRFVSESLVDTVGIFFPSRRRRRRKKRRDEPAADAAP